MAEMAIFYDASKCTACKGCQVACKQWNQLPSPLTADEYEFTKSFQSPLDLSHNTWLIIDFTEDDTDAGFNWNFMRHSCFHCTEAGCEMACPVGAISKLDNGSVVIDQEKCIGCQYCVSNCPFSVPRFRDAREGEQFGKTFKCWLCQDRIGNADKLSGAEVGEPACVKTCPTGALTFGDRAEMVAAAKDRAAALKDMGFTKAETYGIDELGGLHVIVVAHQGAEAHGLVKDPKVSGVTSFWQLLKPLAGVAAAATVGGLGLSFVLGMGYKRGELRYDDATGEVKEVE